MIFNEQLTQEEYEKRKKEMKLENYSDRERIRKDATEFFKTQPHKYIEEEHNENCTGDHLYDSKNSSSCWDCKDLEDCKYCAKTAENVKTCMDYNSWGFGAELIYMTSSCGDNVYNLKFCTTCTTNNSDLEYCGHCTSCKHCFGCFGLKHKKYCIFNKQYSEEEYEDLKRRIINHMRSTDEYGEYFPKDICPYAYNETIAMEYFPLTKEGATKRGYKWHDEVDEMPEVEKVIDAVQLPDETSKIPDDVLNWALRCKETNRPFRITKQELEFYRDQKIPIPRFHPDERHTNRMKLRPPRKLFERNCDICNKDLKSTFSTERPEKILCDHCYREEVY